MDVGKPFLTYYDDAAGERTELSYATFANWVAKTAHFLRDGLGAGPGDTVGLDLPDHWLTVAIAFAAWRVGASVERGAGDVTFATEDRLAGATGRDVVGVVLAATRQPLSRPYPGVTDYGDEVAAYPDTFDGGSLPDGPADPARRLVDGDVLAAALAAYRGGGSIVFGTIGDPDRTAEAERATRLTS